MKQRTDTERLDFIMPCLSLAGTESQTDKRIVFLSASLMFQKEGRDAIDAAMDAEEASQ